METKVNPNIETKDAPKLSETIQDAIKNGLEGDDSQNAESSGKESKISNGDRAEIFQQFVIDMGMEDSDLEELLRSRFGDAGKSKPSLIKSVKNNAVEQAKQFGASTVASLIAILIAIVTPIILNSQFAKDISETISDIRKQLPNEADALLMSQVTELSKKNQVLINQISSEQRVLQERSRELSKDETTFKQEFQQITQKLIELENQNRSLTDSLSKKVNELESREASKNEKPNFALLKQLSRLVNEGEKLTATQTKRNERWFKQTFYTVQGLQNESFNQQLNTHVAILKSVVEKEGDYREFDKRKEEALIVLEALSSLVSAAIIR